MRNTFASLGGALVAAALLASPAQGDILLFEPFDYSPGNLADETSALPNAPFTWGAHSAGGSEPLQVIPGSLVFPGMDGDLVVGNSVQQTHGSGSRSDAGRPFAYNPGTNGNSLFVSYLVQVNSVTGSGDYHFHLSDDAGTGATFRGRVFLRAGTTTGTVNFGLQYASAGVVYDALDLPVGEVYLVVLEYDSTNASNHVVNLWVNPDLGETTAPAALLTDEESATPTTNIVPQRVNIRQGTGGTADLVIDQIIVATTWAEVTPEGEPPEIITSAENWNMYQ